MLFRSVIGIKGSQGSGLQFPATAIPGIDAMLPLAGGSETATLGFEQRQVEVEVAAKQVDIFAHGAPVVAGGADAGAPDVALVEGWRGDVDGGVWVSKSSFVPTGVESVLARLG